MMFLLVALAAKPASAASLEIVIENSLVAEGQIMIRLLQGEAEFKGESPAYAALQRRATMGEMRFVIDDLPDAEYGLQVMHDTNGNGELDTNFVGMPREPWAFSNNATGNMGPPKWQDIKFSLDSDSQQSIRLNH
jgi:uncharacterized protein (DUF2141 family)